MTNTSMLNDLIEKSGLKIGFIADCVGISRQLLWKKINNKSPFNQYEIDSLCEVLQITSLRTKEAVFFAKMQTNLSQWTKKGGMWRMKEKIKKFFPKSCPTSMNALCGSNLKRWNRNEQKKNTQKTAEVHHERYFISDGFGVPDVDCSHGFRKYADPVDGVPDLRRLAVSSRHGA